MTLGRYAVLAVIVVCGAVGDAFLSRGMKQVQAISLARWADLIASVWNPWVALGILFLLCFFAAYTTALSWADLTYVLPATSVGYVLMALLAVFMLHEHVSATRWAGILLISIGVGVVTRGPARTDRYEEKETARQEAS
jgi:drug/metabolite transporter (DMT)-like permease